MPLHGRVPKDPILVAAHRAQNAVLIQMQPWTPLMRPREPGSVPLLPPGYTPRLMPMAMLGLLSQRLTLEMPLGQICLVALQEG